MRLLECRIRGFKSFADPLTLDFGEGLSAIVGPNGSGKSNVLDAIKWVLGEQSAKSLRAGRMEDVIFSGSSTRPPLGMAQVSLVIDNSDGTLLTDYEEVVITRRLFRSGQSEYLLNGKPCRLKDITNLFLNTGLSKNAYAFIEQGQIETILTSKPEELRLVFEEAAGIARYKVRKDETLAKLEHTQASLTRVEDIIYELQRDLPELEQRAERAERFSALENQRSEYERVLLVSNYLKRRNALEGSKRMLAHLENRLTELQAVLEGYQAERQGLELELTKSEEQVQKDERACVRLETLLAKYEERLNAVTNALQETDQSRATVQQEVEALEKELADAQERVLRYQKQEEQLENEHSAALLQLKNSSEQLAAIQGSLDEVDWQALDEQGHELEVRIRMIRKEMQDLHQQKKVLTDEIEALNHSIADLEQVAAEQLNTRAVLEHQKSQIYSQLEETEKQRGRLMQQLAQCNDQLNKNTEQLQEAWKNYHRVKSEYDTLAKLIKSYRGYRAGVKLLLEAKHSGETSCQGIIGAVADLLKVPAQYRKAVTAVLGGSLEHIVTVDTDAAISAIEYLKRQKGGRTTFLPLDRVRGIKSQLNQALKDGVQVIGIAADLVDYDSRLEPVVKRLLGRVLVVKDTHTAVRLSKRNKLRLKMVTLAGEVFDPSGSITAGEDRYLKTDLLGRTETLKKLETRLHQCGNETKKLEKNSQALHAAKQRLELELNRLQGQQEQLSQELVDLEKRLSYLGFEIEKSQEQLDDARSALKQASERREEVTRKITELSEEARQLEVTQQEWQSRVGVLQGDQRQMSQLQQAHTELEVAVARLEEQLRYCGERVTQEKAQKDKLEQQLARARQQMNALESQQAELKSRRAEISALVSDTEQQLLSAQKKLQLSQQARQEILAKLAKLEERRQLAERENGRTAKKREQSLVEQTRNEVELRQIEVELLRKAGLSDPSTVNGKVLSSKQEQHLKEQIARFEREAAELGEVDLSAIAEYQRRKERIEYLCKQKTDLQLARQKLEDIIAEIDEICAKRLKDTIQLINESFEQVFTELFQGGSATLCITQPDNILESGVEVQACPPGKKLQRLSLLSGGEKALTAIALLFAIFRVKPAPFCVLDEIDAALDEANNVRLAEYLKRFAAETQFIIITHSKYTMMAADRLYGITMQEQGVSKMVSMKLE